MKITWKRVSGLGSLNVTKGANECTRCMHVWLDVLPCDCWIFTENELKLWPLNPADYWLPWDVWNYLWVSVDECIALRGPMTGQHWWLTPFESSTLLLGLKSIDKELSISSGLRLWLATRFQELVCSRRLSNPISEPVVWCNLPGFDQCRKMWYCSHGLVQTKIALSALFLTWNTD